MENLQLTHLEMKWQTKEYTVDSGVFAMRHLETYMGEGLKGWDCQLSKEGVRELICFYTSIRFQFQI